MNATLVGPTTGERRLVWLGFPVLGAAAGWLVLTIAGWVTSLPWAPLQGPFELVASVADRPWATVVAIAVGIVAGLVVALLAENDYLIVTVDDSRVTVARGESTRDVPRTSIDAVFLDGKQLVLLGRGTEELAREGGDVDAGRLAAAFVAHGYPWQADGDPHLAEFRRWVEDTPDLSAGANALFTARARALDKGDDEDVAQLRAELAKLGIVVRDEKKHQFWRLSG